MNTKSGSMARSATRKASGTADQRVGAQHEGALDRQGVEDELERGALLARHPGAQRQAPQGVEQPREQRPAAPQRPGRRGREHDQQGQRTSGRERSGGGPGWLPRRAVAANQAGGKAASQRRRVGRRAPARHAGDALQAERRADDDHEEERHLGDHERRLGAPDALHEEQRSRDHERLPERAEHQPRGARPDRARRARPPAAPRRASASRGRSGAAPDARGAARSRSRAACAPIRRPRRRASRPANSPSSGSAASAPVSAEREYAVGEGRQRVADEPAQDGRDQPLQHQGRDRQAAALRLGAEPRAEQRQDAFEHARTPYASHALVCTPGGERRACYRCGPCSSPCRARLAASRRSSGSRPSLRARRRVVCHPHPLFGGTMHNHVVYRVARALRSAGLAVLRFNFRGAGASAGVHDGGRGEVDDARAALDFLEQRFPGLALWAGGLLLRLAHAGGPRGARTSASASSCWWRCPARPSTARRCPRVRPPTWILMAGADEFGTLADLRARFPDAAGAHRRRGDRRRRPFLPRRDARARAARAGPSPSEASVTQTTAAPDLPAPQAARDPRLADAARHQRPRARSSAA